MLTSYLSYLFNSAIVCYSVVFRVVTKRPQRCVTTLLCSRLLPLLSVHRTYPICDSPLKRSSRRSFAQLQKSRWNNRSLTPWTRGSGAITGQSFALLLNFYFTLYLYFDHSHQTLTHLILAASDCYGINIITFAILPDISRGTIWRWGTTP